MRSRVLTTTIGSLLAVAAVLYFLFRNVDVLPEHAIMATFCTLGFVGFFLGVAWSFYSEFFIGDGLLKLSSKVHRASAAAAGVICGFAIGWFTFYMVAFHAARNSLRYFSPDSEKMLHDVAAGPILLAAAIGYYGVAAVVASLVVLWIINLLYKKTVGRPLLPGLDRDYSRQRNGS